MEKHVTTTDAAESAQYLHLDEIERRARELDLRWMTRVIWDLEAAEPGELHASTVALLQQAASVFDVLTRMEAGIRRGRAAVESGRV